MGVVHWATLFFCDATLVVKERDTLDAIKESHVGRCHAQSDDY